MYISLSIDLVRFALLGIGATCLWNCGQIDVTKFQYSTRPVGSRARNKAATLIRIYFTVKFFTG